MPFRPRYFQPGAPGHATSVHLERLPGMRQQFVVNVPLFRSSSPRPMARRPTPLRLLPSQTSTQSERTHAAATRPHTHRKRSKAPLAIRTGAQRVLMASLLARLLGDYLAASLSSQYLAASRALGGRVAHPCGLGKGGRLGHSNSAKSAPILRALRAPTSVPSALSFFFLRLQVLNLAIRGASLQYASII
jgi:hypothetical protein